MASIGSSRLIRFVCHASTSLNLPAFAALSRAAKPLRASVELSPVIASSVNHSTISQSSRVASLVISARCSAGDFCCCCPDILMYADAGISLMPILEAPYQDLAWSVFAHLSSLPALCQSAAGPKRE